MEKQFFVEDIRGHFNLRKRHSQRPTNLYFVISVMGSQVKIPTKVKILPHHWNSKTQKPLISASLTELDNRNNSIVLATINTMKNDFFRYIQYLQTNPNELCRAKELAIQYISPMAKKAANLTPLAVIKKGIIEDTTIKESSKKQYHTWLGVFETFLKAHKINLDSFDKLNYELMKEFRDYLQTEYLNPRGEFNSVSHINQQISHVKQLLKKYTTPKYLSKSIVEDICDIKPLRNKVDKHNNEIALRDDEIIKLFNYQANSAEDERIKDMFILDCLTGQRISDVYKIDKTMDNVNGIEKIRLVQKKTDAKVEFDFIFELARHILIDKYNGELPLGANADKLISKHIQRIAKEAGIEGKEIHQEQRGTETQTTSTTLNRWECIKTHTARRTFISLLKVREWDTTKIMHYTGHRNEKTVNQYCKLTQSDYNLFNRLKRDHPEMVLEYTEDYKPSTENVKPTTIQSRFQVDSSTYDKIEQRAIENYKLKQEKQALLDEQERLKQETERKIQAEQIAREFEAEELRDIKAKQKSKDKAWELGLPPDDYKDIQNELNDIHELANDVDWAEEERK